MQLRYNANMKSDAIIAFIHAQRDLFWFIPDADLEGISEAVLVETILNYGSMDAIKTMVRLLGLDTVAKLFADAVAQQSRRRNNYHELTRNYFLHVFKAYAPQYFKPAAA